MNPIIRDHLAATFFVEYQSLRRQLMTLLSDDDLAVRLGGATVSLGTLCREIGEVEHAYIESFGTFRLDFAYRNDDPRLETSVAALTAWYRELDRDLQTALEGISDEDAKRMIVRGDLEIDAFAPPPTTQLDIYREALLIFYGKVSVYLRSMGRAFPPQWDHWIGLWHG